MKDILYHITKAEYIPSILTHGLLIHYSVGLTRRGDQKGKCVFLTDKPHFIFHNQMGENFWKNNGLAIISVSVEGLQIEEITYIRWQTPHENTYLCISEHEYRCLSNVPKENILSINYIPVTLKNGDKILY
jgi:hypothetical protein